jgi:hypothetical protein
METYLSTYLDKILDEPRPRHLYIDLPTSLLLGRPVTHSFLFPLVRVMATARVSKERFSIPP